ncbi:peptidase M28-like protein [Arcicella aurantiaca]|uniref:Peptidase M28-like protein n=2 Tax=Arcicella aurantiaca TaxID=591202 RepID=A0A316DDT3_9BACT|nr:peptidase M28-like protein [Arcicella aurantiaca]
MILPVAKYFMKKLTKNILLPLIATLPFVSCRTVAQLNPDSLAKTITVEDLKRHLTFIASDSLKGRDTGSPEQKVAAQYISNQFESYGLQGVVGAEKSHLQLVDLVKRGWGDFYVKANNKKFNYLSDFISNSIAPLPKEQNFEIVFVGYGIEEKGFSDYANANVKDKLVVVFEGEPRSADGNFLISGTSEMSKWGTSESWKEKMNLAKSKGAKGLFIISKQSAEEFEKTVKQRQTMMKRFGNARLGFREVSDPQGSDFAVLTIGQNMATEILKTTAAELEAGKQKIAEAKKTVDNLLANQSLILKIERTADAVETYNVLGYLEGTDKKDEVVIVTSHYDHVGIQDGKIYNGADDDGSGTVSVLEIAQAFGEAAKKGTKPRRSVLFMTVTGEEKGLLGSEYYVKHPVFPLANTVCDINIDMVGRTDKDHEGKGDYIYVIGSDKLSSELHSALLEQNKSHGSPIDLDFQFNDPNDPNRFYYRSDHYNFAKNNIPVAFFFNGVHDDYHQPTDDVEKIEFNKMEKRARLVFYLTWEVANREKRLAVDSNKK